MKKKILLLSAMILTAVFIPATSVFAENEAAELQTQVEIEQKQEITYLYAGEGGLYMLTDEQEDEVLKNHNIDEVVKRDNLKPVNNVVSDVVAMEDTPLSNIDVYAEPTARTTGSWSINSYVIPDETKVTFTNPNNVNGYFVVGKDERLDYNINVDLSGWLSWGIVDVPVYDLRSYLTAWSMPLGIRITNPGSYKCYAINTENGGGLAVSGSIEVIADK